MLISEGVTPEIFFQKGGVGLDIKGMTLICGVHIIGYNPKNARD